MFFSKFSFNIIPRFKKINLNNFYTINFKSIFKMESSEIFYYWAVILTSNIQHWASSSF